MKIFISYRRDDVRHQAGRLYERLLRTFGKANVFKDVDSIAPGSDFRDVLQQNIARADVVLALIGPRWQGADRTEKSRLEDPQDFVRIELEAALDAQIPIIPVLVDETLLPATSSLPEKLRGLTFRQAAVLRSDPDFVPDADRLVRHLQQKKERVGKRKWRVPLVVLGIALGSLLARWFSNASFGPAPEQQQEAVHRESPVVVKGPGLIAAQPFPVFCWVDNAYYRLGDVIEVSVKGQSQQPVKGHGQFTVFKMSADNEQRPVETSVYNSELAIDAEGKTAQKLKASGPGRYRISCKVTDAKGQTAEGSYVFTVVGREKDRVNECKALETTLTQAALIVTDKNADNEVKLAIRKQVREWLATEGFPDINAPPDLIGQQEAVLADGKRQFGYFKRGITYPIYTWRDKVSDRNPIFASSFVQLPEEPKYVQWATAYNFRREKLGDDCRQNDYVAFAQWCREMQKTFGDYQKTHGVGQEPDHSCRDWDFDAAADVAQTILDHWEQFAEVMSE